MGVRFKTSMCGGTKEDCIKRLKGANKPAAREICIEHDENFENVSLKIGNGEDDYENLPYFINNSPDKDKERTKMKDEAVDTMRSVVKFVIMVAIVLGLALSITIFIFNHRISKLESQLEKYKTESSISDDDEVDNSEENYRDEEDEG